MSAKSFVVGIIGGLAVAAPAFLAGCASTSPIQSAAPSAYTITLGSCTAATQAIAYAVGHGYAADPARRPLIDAVATAAKPVCLGPAPSASAPVSIDTAEIVALNAAVNAINQYALTHPTP